MGLYGGSHIMAKVWPALMFLRPWSIMWYHLGVAPGNTYGNHRSRIGAGCPEPITVSKFAWIVGCFLWHRMPSAVTISCSSSARYGCSMTAEDVLSKMGGGGGKWTGGIHPLGGGDVQAGPSAGVLEAPVENNVWFARDSCGRSFPMGNSCIIALDPSPVGLL